MSDIKRKVSIAKDKILGGVKETVGKASGNETLELDGKILSLKASLKENTNIGDKVDDIKEGLSGKMNHVIDKMKEKK